MNKWQKKYVEKCCGGRKPRTNDEKTELALLGKVKDYIIIDFPNYSTPDGMVKAHREKYLVTMSDCDIPNGKMSVSILATNLRIWLSRGYSVCTR